MTTPGLRLDTSLEQLLRALEKSSAPSVLATIVTTLGSTYRKAGARMLIRADGSCVGLLSGGCLEADLASHAAQVLADGEPRAVEYDLRGPDDILYGVGAGCEGAMRVLLEPAGEGSAAGTALRSAGQLTSQGQRTTLIAVHAAAHLRLGTYTATDPIGTELKAASRRVLARGESEQFDDSVGSGDLRLRALVQSVAPVPCLLLCGAGPDAQPVAASAVALGWRVLVVDHRPGNARPERFPGASVRCLAARDLSGLLAGHAVDAAVVMSHHLESDGTYLGILAASARPGYIGLLGPAARRARLHALIGEQAAAQLRGRLYGPVGLDIGAVTPEGIALSIVSQVHAWLAGSRLLDGNPAPRDALAMRGAMAGADA